MAEMRYCLEIQFFGTGRSKAGGGGGAGAAEAKTPEQQLAESAARVKQIQKESSELQTGRVIDYKNKTVTLASGEVISQDEYDARVNDLRKRYEEEVENQKRIMGSAAYKTATTHYINPRYKSFLTHASASAVKSESIKVGDQFMTRYVDTEGKIKYSSWTGYGEDKVYGKLEPMRDVTITNVKKTAKQVKLIGTFENSSGRVIHVTKTIKVGDTVYKRKPRG